MKIVRSISRKDEFNIKSDHNTVEVCITDYRPELIFEDNSMLIFDSVTTYYDFVDNSYVYNHKTHEVDLETLFYKFPVESDIVSSNTEYDGFAVLCISKIKYNKGFIYYIIRDGINEAAERMAAAASRREPN